MFKLLALFLPQCRVSFRNRCFSPGFSDLQLPEPQIIPAQRRIHRGRKAQAHFYFVTWSDPRGAVAHSEPPPVGDWLWTQSECSQVSRLSSIVCPQADLDDLGGRSVPLQPLLLYCWCGLASEMEKKAKTQHMPAHRPPCGLSWYHKCWRHLTKRHKGKISSQKISSDFPPSAWSFSLSSLTTVTFANHSKANSRKPILFSQRLFLICCFCGWNRIFMNNKSLFCNEIPTVNLGIVRKPKLGISFIFLGLISCFLKTHF